MTIRQVLNDVTALTSRSFDEAEALLYASLNRALDEVGRAFPRKATERLYHAPPAPLFALNDEKAITPDAPFYVNRDGTRSFFFEAYGEGKITVTLYGMKLATYEVELSAPLTVFARVSELSDFDMGDVQITAESDARLYLSSVALFGSAGATVYGEYCRYPVSAFRYRFLSFEGTVKKGSRAASEQNYYLGSDAVYLRYGADGAYDISYLALPDPAMPETLDGEILLFEDAASLLVPLTAYYMALEDENPAAEQYLARYEAMRSLTRRADGDGEGVTDIYGW